MTNTPNIPNRVERLKRYYQVRVNGLEDQSNNSRWEPEKQRIQEKINQLKRIYGTAIQIAEINRKLVDEAIVKKAEEHEANRAARGTEVKNSALQEWLQAGDDPNQLEDAWPLIEPLVLNEWIINVLLSEKAPNISLCNRCYCRSSHFSPGEDKS